MFFKNILPLFKANKIYSYFVLNFSQDWCGSSYRQHHLGESGSISILNSDLYWHGKTNFANNYSIKSGENPSPLVFKNESDVLNYLFSLDFLNALLKRNTFTEECRDVWSLRITKISNLSDFNNFEPFGGETTYEFVTRIADKECLEMLELNLSDYLEILKVKVY